MAMSGIDGRTFSLERRPTNLGSMGAFLNMNKILPPVVVVAGAVALSFCVLKYMRGEKLWR